jgi:hypothetical protein
MQWDIVNPSACTSIDVLGDEIKLIYCAYMHLD